MIGFDLTDEQRMLQATARDFAAAEIRPLVERVRREGEPADPWPLTAPMFARGWELGFPRALVPEEQGGLGLTALDAAIILEELGAADVGVASDLFALNMSMPLMMLRAGSPEQRRAFCDRIAAAPTMLAGAQSEPNVAGSELMMGGPDPAAGPKLSARWRPAGDLGDPGDLGGGAGEWVLNGAKSAFITNAGSADAFFIIARTDATVPAFQGLTIFHMDRGTPGLSVAARTHLIGWPLSTHAGVQFDDVRLPDLARIGPVGGAAMIFGQVPEMPVLLAACFVGLARAAMHYAVAYAAERRSCGRPIAQHQTVALKLAEMAVELEAARLLVWRAAAACSTDPMQAAMLLAPAAKAKAVDIAIANARLCVEVLGGYGVAREYEAGRYLNDALIGWSCDFTRDVLHLGIARALTG